MRRKGVFIRPTVQMMKLRIERPNAHKPKTKTQLEKNPLIKGMYGLKSAGTL